MVTTAHSTGAHPANAVPASTSPPNGGNKTATPGIPSAALASTSVSPATARAGSMAQTASTPAALIIHVPACTTPPTSSPSSASTSTTLISGASASDTSTPSTLSQPENTRIVGAVSSQIIPPITTVAAMPRAAASIKGHGVQSVASAPRSSSAASPFIQPIRCVSAAAGPVRRSSAPVAKNVSAKPGVNTSTGVASASIAPIKPSKFNWLYCLPSVITKAANPMVIADRVIGAAAGNMATYPSTISTSTSRLARPSTPTARSTSPATTASTAI